MAIKILIGGKETETWPMQDKETVDRLKQYGMFRLLFEGEHHEVFERVQRWMEQQQDRTITYIVCNFAGLISKVAADMLFGEIPDFVAGDEGSKEQEALNEIINNNHFQTMNYEMALGASWRGEAIYKLRFGQFADWRSSDRGFAIIEPADPRTFFPILSSSNVQALSGGDFVQTREAGGNKYLKIERHTPGIIRNELYRLDGQAIIEQVKLKTIEDFADLENEQETGFPGLLFEFVPNFRGDDRFWGLSDYHDMESIFDELNNRVSRVSRVLDKHESPKLILPPGIMKEDPDRPGRWYVEKDDLEAIEIDPTDLGAGNANDLPRYLTWDAELEAAFKQIDKVIEIAMMMSETSPDVFGFSQRGLAESGRALKFRLIRTLAKINRKKLYFDQALRNVIYAAQYLEAKHGGGPDPDGIDYRIEWRDGLPDDQLEGAQVEQIRTGGKATSSRENAIRRLDGLKGESLGDELKRIEEDDLGGAPPAPEVSQLGRKILKLDLGGGTGGGD